jgi:RNA polymerase sigma factor (sigma-70 family)
MGEAMETVEEYRLKFVIKNNLILTAIEDMGYTNLHTFAKCEDIGLQGLYDLINLKKPPIGVGGEFSKSAKELMEVLGACPTDLWTEEQLTLTLKKNSQEKNLSKEALRVALRSDARSLIGLDYPEQGVAEKEAVQAVHEAIESLTPREAQVLSLRFGLGKEDEHSLEEVGEKFKIHRERIRQIEAKALKKMRHPSRSDKLRTLLVDD